MTRPLTAGEERGVHVAAVFAQMRALQHILSDPERTRALVAEVDRQRTAFERVIQEQREAREAGLSNPAPSDPVRE